MYLLLDLAVIFIFVLTVFLVTKRGFIKTVFDFGSLICAIIIAKIFTPAISALFRNTLYNKVSGTLKDVLESLMEKGELPDNLQKDSLGELLNKYNISLSGSASAETAEELLDYVVNNIVELLSYAIAFIAVFVIALIALKLAAFALDGIFKLPLLKTINKGLGFVLGLITATIYVLLFVAVIQLTAPYLGSIYPEVFGTSAINRTFIFEFLYYFEWVQFFVN